jgi:pimeloyl-ACP methyl ester carboxylesterase
VVGHDRGARVGARLAWDHPDRVQKLLTLDVAPTLWMYEHTDMAFVLPPPSSLRHADAMRRRRRGTGTGSS